ncbi:MAG: hypothetical protein J6Y74_02795 [Clostridia bacterium]|nr:hypothetical protein [Clostridia bacterium]
MKRNGMKLSLLMIFAVAAMLILSCLFVACGGKEQPEVNNNEPSGEDVTPKSTTKVIITIDGADTEKQYTLEYGQSLTLRKYDLSHYDFDYYTFTAPNGKDYTSEQDGQLWKSADDDRAKLLNWNWEVSTVRIAAHFTPKEYTIKVYGKPKDEEYEYTNILLDKIAYGEHFPDGFIRDVTAKRNKDSGYEFTGITSRNRISDADAFVSSAVEVLNDKDYLLDDRTGVCKLFFNYERGSYTLAFMDYNYNNNRYSTLGGSSECSVKYGEEVCLSDLIHQISVINEADVKRYGKYVHIGWNRKSPTVGTFVADTLDYTLSATFSFDDSDVNRVELYAIWAPLPSADDLVLSLEGLQATVTGVDETKDRVEYFYSTSEAGGRRSLRNGDLSTLPTNTTYTVSVDVYRYYTEENVEARLENAASKMVKSVEAPTLSLANDKLSASGAEALSDVKIILDGKELGLLSDLDEYFLRGAKSGAHSARAYYAYTTGEVECRSALGDPLDFTVRTGSAKIEIKDSKIFLSLTVDPTPVGTEQWNASAVVKKNMEGTENGEVITEFGEFTNLNYSGSANLGKSDLLSDGGYIICEVLLIGDNATMVSKSCYAKIRLKDGMFWVTEEDETGARVERSLN